MRERLYALGGRAFAAAGLAASLLLAAPGAAAQAVPVPVQFDSLDGTHLQGWWFQPPSPGAAGAPGVPDPAWAPRGTVVALHGCGGLYATTGARRGQLNARHQGMADLLVSRGYAVLFPDSLRPRGENEICTQKTAERGITGAHRRADALGALAWAAARPGAVPGRLALLGWSHGGSAVLSAVDASRPDVAAQGVRPALAIAFYPGCADAARRAWRPALPVTILIGALDDWTPPAPCERLAGGGRAEVIVYPDSYHDFDNPVGEVRVRHDVPNGVHPGQGVHAGRNPVAREQAYARVLELLDAAMPAAAPGAASSTNPAVRR